jgi:hypothetical protein
MLQDDCRELSKWLSTRVDSRHVARQAAKEIEMSKTEKLLSILKSECEYPKPLSVNAPLVAEIILVIRRLNAENAEQCRLNGMGAERELALMAKLEAANREVERLRARLEAIYSTEPVAWMRDDGEDGSLSTMTACCSQKVKDLWLKCSPVQVERYTLPLIPLPEKS